MPEYLLSTLAEPTASRRLVKAATCLLAESINDSELLYELELVLTEATSNVVRHAYKGRTPGVVEIRLRVEPARAVEIDVADEGGGFSPTRIAYENPGPEASGGRGLWIIGSLGDEFRVRQEGGKNILHFRKNIGASAWKTCELNGEMQH